VMYLSASMIVCVRRHMCMTIRDGWVRIRASVPTITEPQKEKVYVCVRVCVWTCKEEARCG
jgi:hypothetical protein